MLRDAIFFASKLAIFAELGSFPRRGAGEGQSTTVHPLATTELIRLPLFDNTRGA